MHGIATSAARHVHKLFNAEITLARGCRANRVGFIGEADMQRLAINITENRRGADAQLAASTQDAHGDFTAIGD